MFLKYKNKNIHYRSGGKGKVVTLLHGFGEDGNIWNNLIDVLSKEYFLVVPDIPGSGKSELLEGDVSIEDFGEVLKAINDKENISEVTLIGHSMGGYITLAFAEKYPELLNGFGLFHSSAFADDAEKKQGRLKAIEFISNNGTYAFLKSSLPNLFASDKHLDEIECLVETGKSFSSEALVQYTRAMMTRRDRTEVLKAFKKPVLFIIGVKDTAVPLQVSLKQSYLPSISHVNLLPEAGHMGMIEEPQKCAQIINSFLTQINQL